LNCNLVFSKLFGYSREEILSKPITILMPEIYHKNHTALLKSKQTKERNPNDETFILCMHKSKYLFPAYLRVFRQANMLNSYTFVASIYDNSQFANTKKAYILLNPQLRIIGLSACIFLHFQLEKASTEILNLDNSRIREYEIKIYELCPEIKSSHFSNYVNQWNFFNILIAKNKTDEQEITNDEICSPKKIFPSKTFLSGADKTAFKVFIGEIRMPNADHTEFELLGFYCIFKHLEESHENEDQNLEIVNGFQKFNRATEFQFRYDPNTNIFIRELAEYKELGLRFPLSGILSEDENEKSPSIASDQNLQSVKSNDSFSFKRTSFYGIQDARIRFLEKFIKNTGENNPKKEYAYLREFIKLYVFFSQ